MLWVLITDISEENRECSCGLFLFFKLLCCSKHLGPAVRLAVREMRISPPPGFDGLTLARQFRSSSLGLSPFVIGAESHESGGRQQAACFSRPLILTQRGEAQRALDYIISMPPSHCQESNSDRAAVGLCWEAVRRGRVFGCNMLKLCVWVMGWVCVKLSIPTWTEETQSVTACCTLTEKHCETLTSSLLQVGFLCRRQLMVLRFLQLFMEGWPLSTSVFFFLIFKAFFFHSQFSLISSLHWH